MKRPLLLSLAGIALLAPLVLFAFAGSYVSPAKKVVIAQPAPGCDLNIEECPALLPSQGDILLSLTPHPVPVSAPLEIEVHAYDVNPLRIEVDFSGVEMNMGPNRLELSPLGNNRFAGKTSLPACISGEMAWQATVILETAQEQIVIPFRFTSGDK